MKKSISLTLACLLFSAQTFSKKKRTCYFKFLPNELIEMIFQEVIKAPKSVREYYNTKSTLRLVNKQLKAQVYKRNLKHSKFFTIDSLLETIDKEELDDVAIKQPETVSAPEDIMTFFSLLNSLNATNSKKSSQRIKRKVAFLQNKNGTYTYTGHLPFSGKNLLSFLLSRPLNTIYIKERKKSNGGIIMRSSDGFSFGRGASSNKTTTLSDWLVDQRKHPEIKQETLKALQKLLTFF